MKKKVLVFVSTLSLFILLMGCTSRVKSNTEDTKIEELQSKISSYEKSINELQEKINDYELDIKHLKEERDSYKKIIDSSIKYLSKDEVLELAKTEWMYDLSVDEKVVQSNGVIDVNKSDFKITYSEKQSAFPALPAEINDKGKISGNFFEHLKILEKEPNNTELTDGTVVQAMIYEFQNVQKGTVIKLELSNELKDRLGFKTNLISINVK